mgnify:CR=1 FL=1
MTEIVILKASNKVQCHFEQIRLQKRNFLLNLTEAGSYSIKPNKTLI